MFTLALQLLYSFFYRLYHNIWLHLEFVSWYNIRTLIHNPFDSHLKAVTC